MEKDSKRPPKGGPDRIPAPKDGGLSDDKRYYKAVSNYLANELGLDRNEIRKMLAEKIEARNVDQVVLEAVQHYFGFGVNALNVGAHVKARVDQSVDEHVRTMFKNGAGAWIDKLVQDKLDLMAGNLAQSEIEAARHPALTARRPNLDLYAGAAYLHRPLAENFIAAWLYEKTGRDPVFELQLRPGQPDWPIQCRVKGLKTEDAPIFEGLKSPSGSCRIWGGETTMGETALKTIFARYLGWPEVARLIADRDGILALPARL